GSRSAALDSEASKFRGGCRMPSECTFECLAERRLTRFQGIQRKNRLHSRTTTNRRDRETTALISQKPYHNSSMFSPLMFLLHQPIGQNLYSPCNASRAFRNRELRLVPRLRREIVTVD